MFRKLQLADDNRLTGQLAKQAVTDGGIYGASQLGSFTLARP